jgi:transposase
MREKITEKSFSDQSVYVGIDVHLKNWRVSVLTDEIVYKTFSAPPQADKLGKYLRDHFPGAKIQSAYEAGFSGFWLHRELVNLGIESMVVNPGDVPTTDKERRQKEDARDSLKLAQTLRAGHLKGIFVPSEQIQHDRLLVRTREAIVKDLRRSKSRVKSMLYFEGIRYPEGFERDSTHWSRAFITWLEGIGFTHESAKSALNAHLEMVKHTRDQLLKMTRHIREIARQPHYRQKIELLTSVPGIGVLTAFRLLTELETLERFKSFDKLCSYIGLVPSTHSSGDTEIDLGITPRSNNPLRAALVESSWVAVHHDPALSLSFMKLSQRMPKNKAIIRIAKKLLRRIVHVMRHEVKYEKNVVK